MDRHERTLKRHVQILKEREREISQCALVLYGLKVLDTQPPRSLKDGDDPLTDLLNATIVGIPEWEETDEQVQWTSNKRMG